MTTNKTPKIKKAGVNRWTTDGGRFEIQFIRFPAKYYLFEYGGRQLGSYFTLNAAKKAVRKFF